MTDDEKMTAGHPSLPLRHPPAEEVDLAAALDRPATRLIPSPRLNTTLLMRGSPDDTDA
jgi:hypothetical protein